MPVFRWKKGFVVDGFLDVSHHVVDVLRSRQLAFFSFFVKPHVDTLTRTRLRVGIKNLMMTMGMRMKVMMKTTTRMVRMMNQTKDLYGMLPDLGKETFLEQKDILELDKVYKQKQWNDGSLPCRDMWRGCRTQRQFRREG